MYIIIQSVWDEKMEWHDSNSINLNKWFQEDKAEPKHLCTHERSKEGVNIGRSSLLTSVNVLPTKSIFK